MDEDVLGGVLPPRRDRKKAGSSTKWTRAILFLLALGFIISTTAVGSVIIGDHITALGLYLVLRTVIQTIRSRQQIRRMRVATRTPIIEALMEMFPGEMDWLLKESWNQHYPQWRQKIWDHPLISNRMDIWFEVIERSFARYGDRLPSAGVGIPAYGLDGPELWDTTESVRTQSYPISAFVIVPNEPGNTELTEAAHNTAALLNFRAGTERWYVIELPPGKRSAMAAEVRQLQKMGVDVIVNVDADTIADVDAMANTMRVFLEFPNIHMVTSNVRIKNIDRNKLWKNWIIQWTYYRYDYANHLERGGQKDNVTCGSGPWLAVLSEDLTDEFIEEFLNHTFFGEAVRPGDDRWWTRKLNAEEKGTTFTPDVVVWTDAPTDRKRLYAQLSRWAQSAMINFFQIIWPFGPSAEIWKLTPWSISDTLYLGVFSYLLIGVFLRLGFNFTHVALTQNFETALGYLLPYAIAFTLSNLWKGVYAAITNNHILGLVNALYFIPNITINLPARTMRMFKLRAKTWGGRVEKKAAETPQPPETPQPKE